MAAETREELVLRFAVVLTWDEEGQGWAVSVPAIEGCFTFGETVEEAVAMAEDAIRLNLDDMAARGEALPKPDAVRVETVSVSAPQPR
jgi:antitoxin HicB